MYAFIVNNLVITVAENYEQLAYLFPRYPTGQVVWQAQPVVTGAQTL